MGAEEILKKLYSELERSPGWTASEARTKFDKLLDQAAESPQLIAPIRGHNSEKFVCMSLTQLNELSGTLRKLTSEVRKNKVSEVVQRVRQYYEENPSQDLIIERDPPKPDIDFEG
ncbi:MAG: type II toxin-antitoxin system Phd/YefM family antitoxin [Pseudobdellovibrionaceae bacterium]|nr:type II toxin-antitoxin system Phd/YefM family antitoxin [Pseudobdellovibrionaceae bacterium]